MNTYMKIRMHTSRPALHSHLRYQKRDGWIFISPHLPGPKGDHCLSVSKHGHLGVAVLQVFPLYSCFLCPRCSLSISFNEERTRWSQGAEDFSSCTFMSVSLPIARAQSDLMAWRVDGLPVCFCCFLLFDLPATGGLTLNTTCTRQERESHN